MNQYTLEIQIAIGYDGQIDMQEYDDIVHGFINELTEIDDLAVTTVSKSPHDLPHAKGSAIDVGTIIAKTVEGGAITSLVNVLGSWLSRDRSRILKLQIGDRSLEVTGLSKEEQRALIEWFQIQTGLRFDK